MDWDTLSNPNKSDQEILGKRYLDNTAGESFKYLPLSQSIM